MSWGSKNAALFLTEKTKQNKTQTSLDGDRNAPKICATIIFFKRKAISQGPCPILAEDYKPQSDSVIKCQQFQADIGWEKWSASHCHSTTASPSPNSLCLQHLQGKKWLWQINLCLPSFSYIPIWKIITVSGYIFIPNSSHMWNF